MPHDCQRDSHEVLGLIPARGGSQGIPNKNLAPLAGRPLLAYTCDAALGSRALTRVVLSTDSTAIADLGRTLGVDVPFRRPACFARDDAPMLDVVLHALAALETAEGYRPDAVVLLQPTSPLRRAEHIDAAADLLWRTGADSVVSVVEAPHRYTPASLMRLHGGRLTALEENPAPARRQDKPRLYARNGPAVLATRRETLTKKNMLYGSDCRALVMDADSSVDIDEPHDLAYADYLLSRLGSDQVSARPLAGGRA